MTTPLYVARGGGSYESSAVPREWVSPLTVDTNGQVYTVMTTDFLANVAAGYKDIFATAQSKDDTGLVFNDVIIDHIRKNSPVSAKREGRIVENEPLPKP